QNFCQSGSSHGRSRDDLALAANFRARNRRILLNDHANSTSSEQETACSLAREIGQKITRVMQYRRNNAARTVSGSGDHAATSGILLIDSKGIKVDPFHRRKPGCRIIAMIE